MSPEDLDFDYDAAAGVDRKLVDELATCRYLQTATNVLLIGPPGVGKTHLSVWAREGGCECRVSNIFHYRLLSGNVSALGYELRPGVTTHRLRPATCNGTCVAAAVVPMSLAGIAFFTRIVENSMRSVPTSVVDVARASGGSTLQVTTTPLSEAVPSIIGGLTINVIAMIEYSAIAGTIGAGGIGYVAVTYGYQRFDHTVMIATIVILILTVAAVQLVGDALVRYTTPHQRAVRTV
ncbi:ATP-binding protein [Rhodococcus sp. IEGM 1370]|uniref:ATP-binding protein n=1 Tax=unclassified Rhodococcus (in: high G+C Gram-positive bacteria) TaxID=192944 RepID=UPI0021D26BA9|nr:MULTISPECIES: ATP-binding protein [unclassified Rhodococcus (in: high G+C Gram-positive bacteria)]MDV8076422.1 ATP-binding protein [Rhodococcus sp. IEGM 1370]